MTAIFYIFLDEGLPLENANHETLQKVIGKLQKVVKELLDRWDLRQPRTKLQEATSIFSWLSTG